MADMRLALNADTTPLSISDTLVFKPLQVRAAEAAAAGFRAVNVDAEEGLGPDEARRIVAGCGLEVAAGFFHAPFYEPEAEERILDAAARRAEFARALGQDTVFCSALVAPAERHAIAGSVTPETAVALDARQFHRMARLLERIARLWQRQGITLCVHPHAATYVEAPHEIERLLELTDPALVRLGPDTGHLFFGGADPLAFVERHLERVAGLHVKDIRPEVVAAARRLGLDYRQATARGVWTELGEGCVNFPALFRLLRDRAWSGWIVVETDHTRLPTALESSRASRRYLREVLGL
jgi:inosose dehydratase